MPKYTAMVDSTPVDVTEATQLIISNLPAVSTPQFAPIIIDIILTIIGLLIKNCPLSKAKISNPNFTQRFWLRYYVRRGIRASCEKAMGSVAGSSSSNYFYQTVESHQDNVYDAMIKSGAVADDFQLTNFLKATIK